jgi:Cu/Ag efflux protein CusF
MKFVMLKHVAACAALLLSFSLPHPVCAATGAAPTVAPVGADMTDGEIRKIDKEAMKVTIKHGEIKSLDMPPMTMVFRVKDAALLEPLKLGDKIKFKAVSDKGTLVVTELQAVKPPQ